MLNNLDKLTQKVTQDPISVNDGLCSRQRNKDSACNSCAEVCPTEAITMEWVLEKGTTPTLDLNKCNLCGACYSVCPNGVYDLKDEPADKILRYADSLSSVSPHIRFECDLGDELAASLIEQDPKAQTASLNDLQKARKERPKDIVYLPCLARIDESLLVGMASKGMQSINMLKAKCADCGIASVVPTIDNSIATANRFLEIYGAADTKLRFDDSFAADTALPVSDTNDKKNKKDANDAPDYETFEKVSRRSFLKKAKTESLAAGVEMVEDKLPDFFQPPEEIQEGLIYELPKKRRMLLDGIKEMNAPANEREPVGDLPLLSIDINSKCTGCKWCALYCPTKALSVSTEENLGVIKFNVAHCTKCNLCTDICYDKAIDTLDTFSAQAFRSEESDDLITQKIYFCSECKQEFLSMEYAQRCTFCDKKHELFGEMDGEFLWDTQLKTNE